MYKFLSYNYQNNFSIIIVIISMPNLSNLEIPIHTLTSIALTIEICLCRPFIIKKLLKKHILLVVRGRCVKSFRSTY